MGHYCDHQIGLLTYKRLSVIIPFVMFALIVPFIGGEVGIRAWRLAIGRRTVGNVEHPCESGIRHDEYCAVSNNSCPRARGMTRLKVPRLLVAIIAFMLRYIDVLVEQLGRMRRSMVAEVTTRDGWQQIKPIASSAGALFVRSYGGENRKAMLAFAATPGDASSV